MKHAVRVLGIAIVLFLCGCEQTKFEQLVNIPSKFELVGFGYTQFASLQVRCWFNAYADNRGIECAAVKGTIDWGDGVIEYKDYISPCVSVTNFTSWSTAPMLSHSYPALGSYVVKAELTAHFTNGSVTSKLQVNIDVTY